MSEYAMLKSLPKFSVTATEDVWLGIGSEDIVCMPIAKNRDNINYNLNTTENTAFYLYKKSRYEYTGSTYGIAICGSGDSTNLSTLFYYNNSYWGTDNQSIAGTITPALIRKGSEIYNRLVADYSAIFVDASKIRVGKYIVKNLVDFENFNTCSSYIINPGYNTYGGRTYYPMRNVKINDTLYDWISPSLGFSYGYESSFTLGTLTFPLSSLRGWREGTNELITLKVGDVIEIYEDEVLPSWGDWLSNNTERIFNGSLEIYNANGTGILTSIDKIPAINSARIDIVDNKAEVYLYGVNSLSYNIEFDIPPVENKVFSGLSFAPNKASNIPADNEVHNINLAETPNKLFCSYRINRPITESFDITLYQNTAENNRLDKTSYLTSVGTISGALREETSLTDMSITIEYPKVPDFNYVYIPSFNRYYYVTDIVSVRKNLWEISLSVDVLMTYKDAIRNLSAFVDRNENVNNADIIDEKRVIEQGYDVESIEVQNALFKDDSIGSYLITGLGFVALTEEET